MLKFIGSCVQIKKIEFNSILLSFLINTSSIAQVKIEEEVILGPVASIKSETLFMPFYGKISGIVNSADIFVGSLNFISITADNQSVTFGSLPCPQAPIITNPDWQILNLPEGTPIIVKTYICNNNSISIETETNIEIVSTDHCKINYKKLDGNWSLATTVKFTATSPPECEILPSCYDGFVEEMPTLTLEECDPSAWTSTKFHCDNETTAGFFTPGNTAEFSDLWYYNKDKIGICFDLQTQEVKFDLTSISIPLNYMLTLCEEN